VRSFLLIVIAVIAPLAMTLSHVADGLFYRGDDEDKGVPEHMGYEDRYEAPRIPVESAPVHPADKGGEYQNRVPRGQVHPRVEDYRQKECSALTPPHLEKSLYKAPPVYLLSETNRKEKQDGNNVLRQFGAARVYSVKVLCPPRQHARICACNDQYLMAQPEDPIERHSSEDTDTDIPKAPIPPMPGNFSGGKGDNAQKESVEGHHEPEVERPDDECCVPEEKGEEDAECNDPPVASVDQCHEATVSGTVRGVRAGGALRTPSEVARWRHRSS